MISFMLFYQDIHVSNAKSTAFPSTTKTCKNYFVQCIKVRKSYFFLGAITSMLTSTALFLQNSSSEKYSLTRSNSQPAKMKSPTGSKPL